MVGACTYRCFDKLQKRAGSHQDEGRGRDTSAKDHRRKRGRAAHIALCHGLGYHRDHDGTTADRTSSHTGRTFRWRLLRCRLGRPRRQWDHGEDPLPHPRASLRSNRRTLTAITQVSYRFLPVLADLGHHDHSWFHCAGKFFLWCSPPESWP